MSESYNLIFFPTVKPGENEAEVKSKLAATLKVDQAKINGWYATGKPTVLLKEVAPDIADRYMQAILKCGANCNMQPSGGPASSLSLVPKPAAMDYFVCPQCGFEDELPPGSTYAQCPKCDLVIAKWADRQDEERKKEEIRRRLLRDARLQTDEEDEAQRKQEELAHLKSLEQEIMKELGMKPPGRFIELFNRFPVSFSVLAALVLVGATAFTVAYVKDLAAIEARTLLLESTPSEEVRAVAPFLVDAAGLNANGNGQLVAELAEVTDQMQGTDRRTLTNDAERMLKGAGSESFLSATGAGVTRETIGGVKGLTAVSTLPREQLDLIAADSGVHGHDRVIEVLTQRIRMPDVNNPNGPDVLIEQIEQLDGSRVVELMKTVAMDIEWDAFLFAQARRFLVDADPDSAAALIDRIRNPGIKATALSASVVYQVRRNPGMDLKLVRARIANELASLQDPDRSARTWLDLGVTLARAGVPDEPGESIRRVENLLDDSAEPKVRAQVAGRLGVAQVALGNIEEARVQFGRAQNLAAELDDLATRLSAFALIAQRLFDARNVTLTSEILAEAQLLSATELDANRRFGVLADIAAAQLYVGDHSGALMTVSNAASGDLQQQLLVRLAAWLIAESRPYQAQQLMEAIERQPSVYRLALRLVSQATHAGEIARARALLQQYEPAPALIRDLAERALVLSQFGRAYLRLGEKPRADRLFSDAQGFADQLSDRKQSVTRGLIAMDQARGLQMEAAWLSFDSVTEFVVKEPLEAQLDITQRVVLNLLPATAQTSASR